MCVSVALLAWFGFRASREFQQSSTLLVQRRADEAVRLLAAALTRDMRAAQTSVLASSTWDESGPDAPHDVNALVASAFARYPYPEVFLALAPGTADADLVFYARADRTPSWAPPAAAPQRYPVRTLTAPRVAAGVLAAVRRDAAVGQSYSVSEVQVDGVPYQVVVLLKYSDHVRQHLASARGFMVNLPWVRQHYFAELLGQVTRIAGDNPGLTMTIVDDRGNAVAGEPGIGDRTFVSRRAFPVAFFDPVLVATNRRSAVVPLSWTALVSAAGDPALGVALYGADITLALAALAAFMLALGLGVTARAIRLSAELAEMRAEFMSSVTHELKTPIASIQAMGETLSRGRLRDPRAQQDYAAVVTQEAKRLGRLVNNVLAYSRITDVADVYSFEPLDIEDVIDACLGRFNRQLQQEQFTVTVDIPADVPPVLADGGAMELLFDNLIDNAVRHSGATKDIRITVRVRDGITVEIADQGVGIAADDLAQVTQKFVRGRNAAAGGSGLGLAIVARIVNDHHGSFGIDSTLGAGTTVRVTLPAAAEERVERKAALMTRASL
jgi:signal transduction histidine kinase